MELNRLVFPRPTPSYSHSSLKGRIIYVPKFQLQTIHFNQIHLSKLSSETLTTPSTDKSTPSHANYESYKPPL